MIAVAVWAAYTLNIPGWARWTLAGAALAIVTGLAIAVLVGPAARRLAGQPAPLTATDLEELTASERLEAVNAARHTLIQAATGLVVIGGVVFTALGLWYTARTVETAQESQLTDRYTKAVEQLGSPKPDVRLGGIYALQRLAADSPRDTITIGNVLAAYVRNHDTCTTNAPQTNLPKQCTTHNVKTSQDTPLARPGTDVLAALSIALALTPRAPDGRPTSLTDFTQVRFPYTDLTGVNLTNADLTGADLTGANLSHANLTHADLSDANLTNVYSFRADLPGVSLADTDLTGATLLAVNLTDATLVGANLRGADLGVANLTRAYVGAANLTRATLNDADLTDADLTDAKLAGADLRHTTGMTEKQVRAVAKVDATTKF
ncbi:pentapeptide repeat-containing protein [Sphaerisporangium sp. NPDC005288]|uniref:pentapeptide repeat-containing protein n=1 Tax=Sphaerisporangium sp. NPDC005288 TaxID=3155114 RepID=UPI0033B8E712